VPFLRDAACPRALTLRLAAAGALAALVAVPAFASAGSSLEVRPVVTCTSSGTGLALSTTAPLHYTPAGQAPVVTATAAAGDIRYAVRERSDVRADRPGEVRSARSGAVLQLPAALPGLYEVSAELVVAGSTVARACLTYGIGAEGASFEPAALPAGADWGGPAPERAVAITSALGFGDARAGVDFGQLFATGTLDVSRVDAAWRAAATRAAAAGVAFHVQVGQGSPAEVAAVRDRTWEDKVEQLVRRFAGVVPAWEAWNEPNVTYADGDAAAYVRDVLVPFSRAVHRADPTAKVIGASTLGYDASWFGAFAKAGGFAAVDVVAIHPYTAHGRTWTEQGTVGSITALRGLMARNGAGSKPLWNTESAWYSTGDYNLYASAVRTAESLVLARALDIRMAAFLVEGGWQDWSLIDPRTGVKPGALAAINSKVQLGSRRFLGWGATTIPHTTVARFDGMTVAWTDGLTTMATVSGATAVYDVLGRPVDVSSGRTTLTSAPTYFAGNAVVGGSSLGVNVAKGGRAVATSGSAAGAVDGRTDNGDSGDLASAWTSSSSDTAPALTVTLASPSTVRGVLVATASSGSVLPGLRDYTVELRDARGSWRTVATQTSQVWDRMALFSVSPQVATAARITVQAVNDSGIRQIWPGAEYSVESEPRRQAVVQELEVYGAPLVAKAPVAASAAAAKAAAAAAAKKAAATAAAAAAKKKAVATAAAKKKAVAAAAAKRRAAARR
jgi:hypothetical protein